LDRIFHRKSKKQNISKIETIFALFVFESLADAVRNDLDSDTENKEGQSQQSSSSTSNTRVELGGIQPGTPPAPYPMSGEMVSLALWPLDILATPSSQPAITCKYYSKI